MAVQKNKTSVSKLKIRNSVLRSKKVKFVSFSFCLKCNQIKKMHTICLCNLKQLKLDKKSAIYSNTLIKKNYFKKIEKFNNFKNELSGYYTSKEIFLDYTNN